MYFKWLANVIVVKKANGKWRIHVNFIDLNKACSKDNYQLSRIYQLIDSIMGYKLFSFLDAYSGYHQISMVGED